MTIERPGRRIAAARLASTARLLLDASALCAIATVTPDGDAYVNTAYFAWGRNFEIVWISDPDAMHSRNLSARSSTAIAVYDSDQRWGHPDRGIQLFGSAAQATGASELEARTLYLERFPRYGAEARASYHLYRFEPVRLKLFDERVFGAATFVTARVEPGGSVAWESTVTYQGDHS